MPLVVWLIPLFPLLGTVVNAVLGGAIGRRAHWVAVPAIALSFVAACGVFARVWHGETWTGDLFPWISAGAFRTAVTVQVDQLSAVMLLVVTGVSFLIHLYSIGYMRDDAGYARFFTYLNLFVFSMVMLVLAGNFLLLYVFWEGVGLCSYLLIGFWYDRPAAADAGKKAFIVNRVGDFGFGLAIMWIWIAFGTLDYVAVFKGAETLAPATATGIALLLFMGACGKSAQVTLHVWLPDAMEGPTPVSALIHAATMVAAGVYMLVRVAFVIQSSPTALLVIAWVGTITAVMAALLATQQNDIKRILAYSTLSQLGYMIMAVGLASNEAAMFHLFTHAFFKALLFLAAGSVIVMLHHEQDIWKMGGLSRRLPITFVTFAVGALALIGCPPFSGFFSKDAILALAYERNTAIFAVALFTAFLTAFYVIRMLVIVFFGTPHSDIARESRESPPVMTVPLIVLALLAALGGFAFFARNFLTLPVEKEVAILVPTLAIVALIAGSGLAIALYRNRAVEPVDIKLLRHKFYFDEFYGWLIYWTQELLARVAAFIDRWVIDAGAVGGTSRGTWGIGALLRLVQVGNLQAYLFLFGLGVVAIIYFAVFR